MKAARLGRRRFSSDVGHESDYYEANLLGYSEGTSNIAEFLSKYIGDTQPVQARKRSEEEVVSALYSNALQARLKRGAHRPSIVPQLASVRDRAFLEDGKWVVKKKGVRLHRGSPEVPDIGRSRYDVFLTTPAPLLSSLGGPRPAGRKLEPLPPRTQSPSPKASRATSRATSRAASPSPKDQAIATSLQKELDEFEERHKNILQLDKAIDTGAKAVGVIKASRMMQLIALKRTPFPVLFRGVSGRHLQQLYTSVAGSLGDPLRLESFTHLLSILTKPEVLPIESVESVFKVFDLNGNGQIDFVEFISTLFSLLSPPAVQDTVKQLHHLLEKHFGKVRKACLNRDAIVHVIQEARAESKERGQGTLTQRSLCSWGIFGTSLQEAARGFKTTDTVKLPVFITLIYLNEQLFAQLSNLSIC